MEMIKDNREKILDVAMALFAEKGYDAVGVQLICEKAEVSKPTLYYYYESKAGILKEILRRNYERLNTLLEQQSRYIPNVKKYFEDVYPVLIRIANAYFDFARNNRQFYAIAQSALFAPPESELYSVVKEFNGTQYDIIEKMFKNMSRIHRNMTGHEKRQAWTFIGMINIYIILNQNPKTEDLVHQFMHGIF